MIKTIHLPTEFFPATEVIIDYDHENEVYPVIIYGFDGNTIYEERTNIYLMKEEENISSIAEIGNYLCKVFKISDEDA